MNRENGQTFVIVTHDLTRAVCDRIVRMQDGEILASEPVQET